MSASASAAASEEELDVSSSSSSSESVAVLRSGRLFDVEQTADSILLFPHFRVVAFSLLSPTSLFLNFEGHPQRIVRLRQWVSHAEPHCVQYEERECICLYKVMRGLSGIDVFEPRQTEGEEEAAEEANVPTPATVAPPQQQFLSFVPQGISPHCTLLHILCFDGNEEVHRSLRARRAAWLLLLREACAPVSVAESAIQLTIFTDDMSESEIIQTVQHLPSSAGEGRGTSPAVLLIGQGQLNKTSLFSYVQREYSFVLISKRQNHTSNSNSNAAIWKRLA